MAGRIEARPGELSRAVDAWHARLTARKLRCAGEYRAVLRKAVRDEGWSEFADFEAHGLSYLDAKVNSGDWKGVTYNRNLVVFKSFSAFQAKLRKAPDLIEDADWAEDDRGDPTRAPTLEEARAIVAYACARAMTDGKVSIETPRSLALALGMGLRPREADKLRWKHVKLGPPDRTPAAGEAAHIWWTKEIQKNKRAQTIAMSGEMAALLTEHRAWAMGRGPTHVRRCKFKAPQIRKVDPRDPEAFVFGETFLAHDVPEVRGAVRPLRRRRLRAEADPAELPQVLQDRDVAPGRGGGHAAAADAAQAQRRRGVLHAPRWRT